MACREMLTLCLPGAQRYVRYSRVLAPGKEGVKVEVRRKRPLSRRAGSYVMTDVRFGGAAVNERKRGLPRIIACPYALLLHRRTPAPDPTYLHTPHTDRRYHLLSRPYH